MIVRWNLGCVQEIENSDPKSFGNWDTNWDLGKWVDPDLVYDRSDAIEFIRSATKRIKNGLQVEVDTNDRDAVAKLLNVETLEGVDMDQVITMETKDPKCPDDNQSISNVHDIAHRLKETGWSSSLTDKSLRETENDKIVIVFIRTQLLTILNRQANNNAEQNVKRIKQKRKSNENHSETITFPNLKKTMKRNEGKTSTKRKRKSNTNESSSSFDSLDSHESTDEEDDDWKTITKSSTKIRLGKNERRKKEDQV